MATNTELSQSILKRLGQIHKTYIDHRPFEQGEPEEEAPDDFGGIYEHKLARTFGLDVTAREGPFFTVLDELEGAGLVERGERRDGFVFLGVKLTQAGIDELIEAGVLASDWQDRIMNKRELAGQKRAWWEAED